MEPPVFMSRVEVGFQVPLPPILCVRFQFYLTISNSPFTNFCERCQVSFANLVVAGSDGEDRMPNRSVFTALPSTAGTF